MQNNKPVSKTEKEILDYLLDQVPDNFRSSTAVSKGWPIALCEMVRNLRIDRMQEVAARLNAPARPHLVEKVA